jgi:Adaptor complexes medium subunit family
MTFALRGLFLIYQDRLVLSKRWPTVETRARDASAGAKMAHASIPCDAQLLPLILAEYERTTSRNDRKSISREEYESSKSRDPLAQLNDRADEVHFLRHVLTLRPQSTFVKAALWPLVCVRRGRDFILCALPLVDPRHLVSAKSHFQVPAVTASLELLDGMATELLNRLRVSVSSSSSSSSSNASGSGGGEESLSPWSSQSLSETESLAAMAEVYALLAMMMPFGAVVGSDVGRAALMLRQGFQSAAGVSASASSSSSLEKRRPAWKPYVAIGDGVRVELAIEEFVSAVQYCKAGVADAVQAWGKLVCRASLHGVSEVSLPLNVSSERQLGRVLPDSLQLHRCAHLTNAQRIQDMRIGFAPPLERFVLANYAVQCSQKHSAPLRGIYQMKPLGNDRVQVVVQFKLHARVKNEFDYFVVSVPFFEPRGAVIVGTAECSASVGSVSVDPKRRNALRWNIGERLPTRAKRQAILKAAVTLRAPDASSATVAADDPFLTGSNSYVEAFFRLSDATLSGLYIDARALDIFPKPTSKLLVRLKHQVSSDSFIVWNSLGDVRRHIAPS